MCGFISFTTGEKLAICQNLVEKSKMGRGKPKAGKKKNKNGKENDKTPQELPAKKMEDMTNEELNALLIPGISMLDDDYGMECLLIN